MCVSFSPSLQCPFVDDVEVVGQVTNKKTGQIEEVRPKVKAEAYLDYFREYQRDSLYLDTKTYSRHVRKVAGFLKDMVGGKDLPVNASLLLQGVKDAVKPKTGYFARLLGSVKADTVRSTIMPSGTSADAWWCTMILGGRTSTSFETRIVVSMLPKVSAILFVSV